VRGVALVLSLLVAAPAAADYVDMPTVAPVDPDRGNFWRDLLWPHKDEVDQLLAKAQLAVKLAEQGPMADYDPSGTERLRFYRATLGPLRYARKLAPDNVEVLKLLAHVADEQGRTREAIDALQTAISLTGIEKAGAEVNGRLGIIYLRMNKVDDAIRYLRAAQGPVVPGQMMTAHVLVHLSHALATRGQMSEAIDVLANNIQASAQYYPNELSLILFALAVQYDRDEQRGAAFEILDKMQNALQGQIGTSGAYALGSMRFTPAADRHYYWGLLYEADGKLSEARTEFALYAASGDLPYRRRALEHVAGIDAMLKNPHAAVSAPAPPQQQVPRRYRRVP
jgi:tetratricopeptide (TPR) repeat protein